MRIASHIDAVAFIDHPSSGYAHEHRSNQFAFMSSAQQHDVDIQFIITVAEADEFVVKESLENNGIKNATVLVADDRDEEKFMTLLANHLDSATDLNEGNVSFLHTAQVAGLLNTTATDAEQEKYGFGNFLVRNDSTQTFRAVPPRIKLSVSEERIEKANAALENLRTASLKRFEQETGIPPKQAYVIDIFASHKKPKSDMADPTKPMSEQPDRTAEEMIEAAKAQSMGTKNLAKVVKLLEDRYLKAYEVGEIEFPVVINPINGQHCGHYTDLSTVAYQAFKDAGTISRMNFANGLFGEENHLRGDSADQIAFVKAMRAQQSFNHDGFEGLAMGVHLGQGDTLKHFDLHSRILEAGEDVEANNDNHLFVVSKPGVHGADYWEILDDFDHIPNYDAIQQVAEEFDLDADQVRQALDEGQDIGTAFKENLKPEFNLADRAVAEFNQLGNDGDAEQISVYLQKMRQTALVHRITSRISNAFEVSVLTQSGPDLSNDSKLTA